MTHVALYARVSTDRQDHERQIRELEEFVGEEYPDASVERFADMISGTDDEGCVEYHHLR
ncbi:recombinase family protein [Halorubrum ezzemoulense]|uniref:recombinase family protein n=1 Tax=Halorubrum ezzemoulense TaxID=337243 RepID=UPI003CCC43B7